MQWQGRLAQGRGVTPRERHVAFATDQCLFVHGGWSGEYCTHPYFVFFIERF
jgi:hypothetical protein